MTIVKKFNEDNIIQEIKEYVESTYSQHYVTKNNTQIAEVIIDADHGDGFCIGNILKYAHRYGNKGGPTDARKDLMKIIHYSILAIYNHDRKFASPLMIDPDSALKADPDGEISHLTNNEKETYRRFLREMTNTTNTKLKQSSDLYE